MDIREFVQKAKKAGTFSRFVTLSGASERYIMNLVYENRRSSRIQFIVGFIRASNNDLTLHDLRPDLFGNNSEGVENLKALEKACKKSLRAAKQSGHL